MPDLTAPQRIEVAARTVLEKAGVAPVGGAAGAEVAAYLAPVKTALAEQGYQSAAEAAAHPPIDGTKITAKTEQIGGLENPRNADGTKDRSPAERARLTSATGQLELYKKFLEQGFGSLNPAEIDNLTRGMRNQASRSGMIKILLEMPGNPTLTADRYRAFAEKIAQDPTTSTDLRRVLNEFLTEQNTLTQSLNAVVAAEAKVKEKTIEKDRKKRELDEATDNKTATESLEQSFQMGGAKRLELDGLITSSPTIQAAKTTATIERDGVQLQLNELLAEENKANRLGGVYTTSSGTNRSVTDIRTEISQKQTRIAQLSNTISDNETKLQRITDLQKEQASIPERKGQTLRAYNESKDAFDTATQALQTLTASYADAKTAHVAAEQAFIDRINNMPAEVMAKWISGQNTQIETAIQAESTKLADEAAKNKADAKAQLKEKLNSAVETKLTKEVTRHRGIFAQRAVTETVVDPQKAAEYNRRLMTEGPKGVMRQLLIEQGVAPADADAAVADAAFVQENQVFVVTSVLARQVMSNGLSPSQIKEIGMRSWGESMVTQACARSEALKKEIESVAGLGALKREGFMGRLWGEFERHPWLFWMAILAILGIPFAGIAGVPAALGAAGAGAVVGAETVGASIAAARMHPASEDRS